MHSSPKESTFIIVLCADCLQGVSSTIQVSVDSLSSPTNKDNFGFFRYSLFRNLIFCGSMGNQTIAKNKLWKVQTFPFNVYGQSNIYVDPIHTFNSRQFKLICCRNCMDIFFCDLFNRCHSNPSLKISLNLLQSSAQLPRSFSFK